jgi:hypothetical protein
MKKLIFLVTFCVTNILFSQLLVYKSNGNITDIAGNNLKVSDVKSLLSVDSELLKSYELGRDKKTLGNVMYIGGATLIIADLAKGATSVSGYPSILTYIGIGTIVLAIPVKMGFSKKISQVVNDYNQKLENQSLIKIEEVTLINNQNGIGFRISF